MRSLYSLLYVVVLFVVVGFLPALENDNGSPTFSLQTATASKPAVFPDLQGTWSGTWTDTLYSVTGAVTFVIWHEGADYEATGSIDLSALGAGVLGGTASATDNGTTLDVTFTCTNLGNGTVALNSVNNAAAKLTASGTGSGSVSGGALEFGAFTLTGTASETEITGSFDFTSPGGGKGIATMTRASVPVETESWGSVKAAFRNP